MAAVSASQVSAQTQEAADAAPDVKAAARYLLAQQRPDGLLIYDADLMAEPKVDGPYRRDWDGAILGRNAGAALALSEYLLYVDPGDDAVRDGLRRLLTGLARESKPIGRSWLQRVLERLGVFDLPIGRFKLWRVLNWAGLLYDTEGDGRVLTLSDYDNAFIGTTALALTAAANYQRATGDTRFADLRRDWVAALMAMTTPGGRVRELPRWLESSEYADGETWLALAHAADLDGDPDVRARMTAVERRLLRKYADGPPEGFFHWGATAAAYRCDQGAADACAFAADLGVRHLAAKDADSGSETDFRCGLLEGLGSALRIASRLPDRSGVAHRLTAAARAEVAGATRFQVTGAQTVSLAENSSFDQSELDRQIGGFRASTEGWYLRIDFTQHCLSGLIKAMRAGVDIASVSP